LYKISWRLIDLLPS